MKPIVFFALWLFCGQLIAQSQAGRQVIGCFGHTSLENPATGIAATGGEGIIGPLQRNGVHHTQGFHQPKSNGFLTALIETTPSTCPSSTDGIAEITEIFGCEPPYVISWSNGMSGMRNERNAPGHHSVTISAGPCSVVLNYQIIADPEGDCVLKFFTAFSPNGDGVNDVWEIENVHLPDFSQNQIEIFNRWGQKVWSADNYDNRDVVWNGRDRSGKTLPVGTYFFVGTFGGISHKGYVEITL